MMKNRRKINCLILALLYCLISLAACGQPETGSTGSRDTTVSEEITSESTVSDENLPGFKKTGSMELYFARQFSVDYYEGGYNLITIAGQDRFLTIPENAPVPEGLDGDIRILQFPLNNIYMAASSAMDLVRELGALDKIAFTGTQARDWSIPEIRELVENETILYGGKYNTPDYELLSLSGCSVAIESTMINHVPEVREQLEILKIPVMTEYSSHEPEPLGRAEWIRLYGLLTGKDAEAEAFMKDCKARLEKITAAENENERPDVVFFYIAANGYVNVRKPGDYITNMIRTAGGRYVFEDLVPEEENSMSTINMDMESFYKQARNADILIYNGTVGENITTMAELLGKNQLLADFKSVREGNVWFTGKNSFQETTGIIGLIEDFYSLVHGDVSDMNYLKRIE